MSDFGSWGDEGATSTGGNDNSFGFDSGNLGGNSDGGWGSFTPTSTPKKRLSKKVIIPSVVLVVVALSLLVVKLFVGGSSGLRGDLAVVNYVNFLNGSEELSGDVLLFEDSYVAGSRGMVSDYAYRDAFATDVLETLSVKVKGYKENDKGKVTNLSDYEVFDSSHYELTVVDWSAFLRELDGNADGIKEFYKEVSLIGLEEHSKLEVDGGVEKPDTKDEGDAVVEKPDSEDEEVVDKEVDEVVDEEVVNEEVVDETEEVVDGVLPYDELSLEDKINYFAYYVTTLKLPTKKVEFPVGFDVVSVEDEEGVAVKKIQFADDGALDKLLFSDSDLRVAFANFNKVLDGREIAFDWIGSYYLTNEYSLETGGDFVVKGEVSKQSATEPVPLGYWFTTNGLGVDGEYHPIRVLVYSTYFKEDAIRMVESLDGRNRGFYADSQSELGYIEFAIENIGSSDIELLPAFGMSDAQGGFYSRTGNIYGLPETYKIGVGEVYTGGDWFFSTLLGDKYIAWGDKYAKEYPATFYGQFGEK